MTTRRDMRGKVGMDFYARNKMQPGLQSVQRATASTMGSINRQAGVLSAGIGAALGGNAMYAAAAAGTALVGMAASSVTAFAAVEKKWAEVTTLMPSMQEEALASMQADINRFARQAGTTLEEAYTAAYQAVSAGIAPEDTAEFLRTAHRAALAGVSDTITSVDALTSAINAYGLEVRDATHLSDAMFTAIRLGKTTYPELAASLGLVMPLASSMNTEFQELTAASAALTAQGNTQALATTQIRAALVALSKETGARSLFESLTGMTYPEWQAQGGTLIEALTMIVKEAERTGKSVPQLFGRIEGAQAALALSGSKAAATYEAAMADVSGATEEAYGRMSETTDHKLNQMRSSWEQFWVGFGEKTAEDFWAMVGNIQDIQQLWGGYTNAEKEAMRVSEENWRRYARNIQRLRNAQQSAVRDILANNLSSALGGGFQPGAVPGVPTAPPVTQGGPGSAAEWLYGVSSGVGQRSGDNLATLSRLNERTSNILLQRLRDIEREEYSVYTPGGGGGATRRALEDNTAALLALTEELAEQQEWLVAPGDAPILPEHLQSADPRFNSRRVSNALAGGRL